MPASFRGDKFFLSNMYPCPVNYAGTLYPSSEHAYQASKSNNQEVRELISKLKDGWTAKGRGKNIRVRDNWNEIRVEVMREILIAKFSQNEELKQMLIDTGKERLVEENDWNDTFWGVCNGKGENILGRLLMSVRMLANRGKL